MLPDYISTLIKCFAVRQVDVVTPLLLIYINYVIFLLCNHTLATMLCTSTASKIRFFMRIERNIIYFFVLINTRKLRRVRVCDICLPPTSILEYLLFLYLQLILLFLNQLAPLHILFITNLLWIGRISRGIRLFVLCYLWLECCLFLVLVLRFFLYLI